MSKRLIVIFLFSCSLVFAGMGIGVVIPSIINKSHLSAEESVVEFLILILMGISAFSASVIASIEHE